MDTKTCACCKKQFLTDNSHKIYCSRTCAGRQATKMYREKLKEDLGKTILVKVKTNHEMSYIPQQTLFKKEIDEDYFLQKYNLFRVENNRGELNYFEISIQGQTFKLDSKGLEFLKKIFDNNSVYVSKGYLARKNGDKIEYFHREFKSLFEPVHNKKHVHHMNFKKNDNRKSNLIVLSKEEHKKMHEEEKQRRLQISLQKNSEKYERLREKRRLLAEEKERKRKEKEFKRIQKENSFSNSPSYSGSYSYSNSNSYEKNRRKKAHSTFMRKFKERNPSESWRTASYKWKKFKEKNNI